MVARGMSTPLDVAVGVLLVGAAVGVVAGIGPAPDSPPSTSGSVVLGSTITVTYETDAGQATVTGTMGGLLADAVAASEPPVTERDRQFVRAVTGTIEDRLDRTGIPVELIGVCDSPGPDAPRLRVGGPAPPDGPVRATVHELPAQSEGDGPETEAATAAAESDRCTPTVVVRRWSS